MIVKKGQLLNVRHDRSGTWTGIATEDFDTEKKGFHPIALAQEHVVEGKSTVWEAGDNMPCRNSLCVVSIIEN